MERFGRYVLLEHVAQGGMAEVFRAASFGTMGFARPLAIKRILPHLAADPHFVRLLIDEAHIASQLSHPNVVQVLDLGQEKNAFFIAMEFVAGRSLNKVFDAALAASHPLPPAFSCHVMAQVLRGLHYAHTRTSSTGTALGVIHRDVSPHNILVSYDGAVKLADFGIAKVTSQSSGHTTGPIKGKPGYMSPEQVKDAPIDQRVDIYAASVVLHELLGMRRLRAGDNPLRVLMEVAKGEFPHFEEMGVMTVPPRIAQATYRGLSVDPAGRWEDAGCFAKELEDACREEGWTWTQADVAQVMDGLFQKEQAQEREAQAHYAGVVRDLAQANTQEVGGILARAGHVQQEKTLPALVPVGIPKPAAGSMGSRLVLGVVAVLALVGGTFLFQRHPDASPAAPVVEQAATGTLIVESQPPGAQVWVAGKLAAGVTPLVVPDVVAGTVPVRLRLEGHVAWEQAVVVGRGGSGRVLAALVVEERALAMSSEPVGARVFLDGVLQGATPLRLLLSGASARTLEVSLPGYASVQQRITPTRAPESLHITLVRAAPASAPASPHPRRPVPAPLPSPTALPPVETAKVEPPSVQTRVPATGRMTLQSTPWARIVLDGVDTGQFTPVANMEVTAGEHEVELINDEEKLATRFSVSVAPGSLVRVSRSLK